MNIWNEPQYKILNMSSRIRLSDKQLNKYYEMLPPICEKLGIEVPELYIELDVEPNSYTYGDTHPFIVVTSGLIETIPDELIATVLAHECGHIACHHCLYTTVGGTILSGANSALAFVRLGSLLSMPLQVAFYYWMRCSEFSADRAAVLCDGSPEKMQEVCMRLAGYDKDIPAQGDIEQFMLQARDYKELVNGSKWNKTLEFLTLSTADHPLTAVRALECGEWADSERFDRILRGLPEEEPESDVEVEANEEESKEENAANNALKKGKGLLGRIIPQKTRKEDQGTSAEQPASSASGHPLSVFEELREYKSLLDEGIITQEEFDAKKKELLG